jgi:hypothetical protein
MILKWDKNIKYIIVKGKSSGLLLEKNLFVSSMRNWVQNSHSISRTEILVFYFVMKIRVNSIFDPKAFIISFAFNTELKFINHNTDLIIRIALLCIECSKILDFIHNESKLLNYLLKSWNFNQSNNKCITKKSDQ